MNCPLCKYPGSYFYKTEFYLCGNCFGIFKDAGTYLSAVEEKARYEKHNNDVNDIGFQQFVFPMTSYILNNFVLSHRGLDFGSGTGSAVSKILQDHNYHIKQYDPFFTDKQALTGQKYNYIVCCEVMEHFQNPDEEFQLLYELLEQNGTLICMTHLYDPSIDFHRWYYKNDPTHIFFYQKETIDYIAGKYRYSSAFIDHRLIVFKK